MYSCSKETFDSFSIEGNVKSKSKAVEGAIASISGLTLRTTTNSDGYFKLLNVPKGNYDLTISKSNSNGSFSEKTSAVTVENNVVINEFLLPQAVELLEPDSIKSNSLKLAWNSSDALDFREYKVYQHNSSGLDESTGTLVHVATNASDTSFIVADLNPQSEYFFRVYVMNEYGKLGGSNIISAKTPNRELILNGSFEDVESSTGFPKEWKLDSPNNGAYAIDNQVSKDGKNSIRIDKPQGVGNMIYQLIRPELLVANQRYKLSYWVKHTKFVDYGEYKTYLDGSSCNFNVSIPIINVTSLPASDWELYEYEFTCPAISCSNYQLHFYFYGTKNGVDKVWIDNFSLKSI